MSKIYDVSVPIVDGGLVYPGNPEIHIALQQSIAAGGSSNVSSIAFGSHTGTHVDAPRHMFKDGATLDDMSLNVLMGPAYLIEVGEAVMSVGRAELDAAAIPQGTERVLIRTRNSGYLTQDSTFHPDYTYLAPDGAEWMIERGVKLVGVDYLSIEQFHSGHHRTHLTLLAASVIIVEGMNFMDVPAGAYDLRCLPIRIAGCDGAPARAVLVTV